VEASTRISVCGFKSFASEKSIDIGPLTVLAGPNSSGKSSIMQPLLLLKQTLEAPGDPGALLLDGPNVRFTSSEQLLAKGRGKKRTQAKGFSVKVSQGQDASLELRFVVDPGQGFSVERMIHTAEGTTHDVRPGMSGDEIAEQLPKDIVRFYSRFGEKGRSLKFRVIRDRCFLAYALLLNGGDDSSKSLLPINVSYFAGFMPAIQSLIHLPGLRGNPRRTYPKNAVGSVFSGTFEDYVASLIFHWQSKRVNRLSELAASMEELGLSWKVTAKAVDDTQVEIRVGRCAHGNRGGAHDLVSIADVGFGVSQSLPVLVALLEARPKQLVYLEQPEIHLHPRAQRRLASLLCQAANRGVQLVVETHSALLLREIQTLVALGSIAKESVKLHWFHRDGDGATEITTAQLDENGSYGDWPEDFDETELEAEQEYLDAIEMKEAQ